MKRILIIFCLCCFALLPLAAQQNLYPLMDKHHTVEHNSLIENGDYLYFATFDTVSYGNTSSFRYQFYLHKYNKHALAAAVDSVYAFGTLAGSDSIISALGWYGVGVQNNELYYCYEVISDSGRDHNIYLKKYDLSLQVTLPDTYIGKGIFQNFLMLPNGNLLISCHRDDSHWGSHYF
jgi:hypothetical protein